MTRNLLLSLALVSLLLASCGLSETDVLSTVAVAETNAVSTVHAQYTQIALLTPSVTNTPLASSTPIQSATPQVSATTGTGATGGAAATGCAAGFFVSDVTVSDGEEIEAGTAFTKTWSVSNTGTCDWDTSYLVIFSSGDQMGGPTSTPLSETVAVGSTSNVSVTLVAPSTAGDYTGYWALANSSGTGFLFLSVVISVP
jgi:hypothetical protein